MADGRSYWTKRRKILANVEKHFNIIQPQFDIEGVNEPDLIHVPTNVCVSDNDEESVEAFDQTAETDLTDQIDFPELSGSISDSDHASDSESIEDSLADKLRVWASTHNISMASLTALLKILNPDHPELPVDSRTLMCTPRNVALTSMKNDALYHHFGIQNGIERIAKDFLSREVAHQTISLQVNIDGLPIFNSSRSHMWPILGKLVSPAVRDVFTIGIHYGKQKPVIPEYLDAFVSEAESMEHGFVITGFSTTFNLKIHSIVCDAPARAFVKKVKNHSGYSSCERCCEEGTWDGRVIFPSTSSQLRTDESFIAMSDDSHHVGNIHSPLTRLNIGMVTSFPLDYMHLVCLGIMKKLLKHWMKGPVVTRISSHSIQKISERLVALREFMPSEFCRKPRELADFDRFKATEFRQLLLYTGPIVFKTIISEDMYKHFMLLCIGMTCLLSSDLVSQYCDYARQLFILFVKNAGALYGDTFLVYNVHCLIHLPDDAGLHGPLDAVSSFPFENYLQQIKKLIRNRSLPLQDVVNRLQEKRNINLRSTSAPCNGLLNQTEKKACLFSCETCGGLLPDNFTESLHTYYKEYRKVKVGHLQFATSDKDGCILYKSNDVTVNVGKICNVIDIDGKLVFVCRRYKKIDEFFSYPLSSSQLQIYLVSDLRRTLISVHLADIVCKCVSLPEASESDARVIYPLSHEF